MKEPVELTVNECLDLLEGGVVGRVALCTPLGPRIVPVNYAMFDGAIKVVTPLSPVVAKFPSEPGLPRSNAGARAVTDVAAVNAQANRAIKNVIPTMVGKLEFERAVSCHAWDVRFM